LTEALGHVRGGSADVVRGGAGTVELTAGRAALREATLVAIDDAGERLSGLCTALLRGEASPPEVSAQLEELRGLLELL
jgi:hypothetical protein